MPGPFDHLETGDVPATEIHPEGWVSPFAHLERPAYVKPDATGAAQAPIGAFANARNAFGASFKGLANLGSRLIHGAAGGATEPTNLVNLPTEQNPQPQQPFEAARQRQDAKVKADIAQNAALAKQVAPYDPTRTSGKVGNVAGQTAQIVGASLMGAGPAMMVGTGAENRLEGIEQAETNGQTVTPGQKAAYLGGGAVLDATIGKLLPSTGAGSFRGVLPAIGATAANTARGSAEMAIYNPFENFLAKQTGVDPNRELMQGEGEAALTGGLISGVTHGVHETLGGANALQKARQQQTESGQGLANHIDRQATPEGHVEGVDQRLNDFQPQVRAEGQAAPESHPEADKALADYEARTQAGEKGPIGPKADPETSARLADFAPVERRVIQEEVNPEDERRFGELTKQATFQSPQEAAPNFFQQKAGEHAAAEEYGKPKTGPQASEDVRSLAKSYAEKSGVPHGEDTTYAPVNEENAKQIASDYDAMKHDPSDPKVKASYDALKAETLAQYQHLKEAGYKFTAEENPPHRTSAEMLADLRDNKHLGVYTGGELPKDHPLAEAAPANDDGLKTYNDMFRVVHDVFGHGKEGVGFGPRGEENAWRQHSQMYSPEARGAMTAETRGQNSWVNFGPHGEPNRANPKETKYAEQKAGLLPEQHTKLNGESFFERVTREGAEKIKSLASDETGAIDYNLTGKGSIYKEEIKPRAEAAGKFAAGAVEAVKSMFPAETGQAHEAAKGAFRANLAEGRLEGRKAEDQFQKTRDAFDKLPEAEQWDIQRRLYDRTPQATPELQKFADEAYALKKGIKDEIVAMGKGAAQAWDDQKFNMLWEKAPAKANALNTQINRPGSLGGAKQFLKSKTLNDFDEGLAKGLVPKYSNPADMLLATHAEQRQFIANYKSAKELVDGGHIVSAPAKASIPDGWSEIPQAASSLVKGVLKDAGKAVGDNRLVAPDQVNRILKNQTTPSLFASGFKGDVYNAVKGANNLMASTLLGLSGFHLKTTAMNTAFIQNARALDLLKAGEVGEAAKASAQSTGGAITNIARGKEIQDLALGKKVGTPEQNKLIDSMKQAGFDFKSDGTYETQIRRKFSKALQDGGVQGLVRAAAYSPMAGVEKLQSGIFDYVQHNKLALGSDMIGDYLRQNPTATREQIRKEGGKISDHLDNTLGLMARDNMFWNRTARDVLTAGTLSVGWNFGSLRAAAGGLIDIKQGLGTLVKGGKVSDLDSRRVSYLFTMGASAALAGAVATYMNTGKGPEELKDYLFPKSGNQDRQGHDIRYNVGTYASDYYNFATHPFDTASAKASPIIHAVTDLARNKDYKGNQIYDSSDPTDAGHHRMALDIMGHIASTNLPMSIQQFRQTMQGGGNAKESLPEKILPWVAIKHAPISESESAAEIAARDVNGQTSHVARGLDRQRAMSDLEGMERDKAPAADINAKEQEYLKAQTLTNADALAARKKAAGPTGLAGQLEHMDPAAMMNKVWPEMTNQEKSDNLFRIRRKIYGANLPADEKDRYVKMLNGGSK